MTQKDMKFRAKDEAHSKAIQEKLFEMGICWSELDFNVQHTDKSFLYVEEKYLSYGETKGFFADDPSTEHILTKDGEIVPLLDDDGYTYWEGGECPVPKGTLVDVKYRDGVCVRSVPAGVSDVETQRYAYNWSDFDGPGAIVAYKLSEKQPTVEASKREFIKCDDSPASQEQPLPTLRPQKEMWLDRAAELLAAMSLCVDNQQKIPYEWIDELSQANDCL